MANRLAQLDQAVGKGAGVLVPSRPTRTRRQSFQFAFQGLRDAFRNEPNLRLQVLAGVSAITCGLLVGLSMAEWLWLTLAIGLVFFSELLNTAIEKTVDLAVGLRPDPLARRVKDIAASFVLVSCILAIVIGCLTFLPHLAASARQHVGT